MDYDDADEIWLDMRKGIWTPKTNSTRPGQKFDPIRGKDSGPWTGYKTQTKYGVYMMFSMILYFYVHWSY